MMSNSLPEHLFSLERKICAGPELQIKSLIFFHEAFCVYFSSLYGCGVFIKFMNECALLVKLRPRSCHQGRLVAAFSNAIN